MTAPQGPYSADLNSGGARQSSVPQGAPYQFAPPQGAPRQFDPPQGAPVQQGARPGGFASPRARACAGTILVVEACLLLNQFVPWNFEDLSLFGATLLHWATWLWVALRVVLIVLAAVFLARRGSAVRYALVGAYLVVALLLAPLNQVYFGGDWYQVFLPPPAELDAYFFIRAMVLWVLNMVGIACAICLAVPDGRPSGAVPAHGAMAPYGSTGGQFPPPGQGAYPVPAQGFGQHPGGGQGFQSPSGGQYPGGAQGFQSPGGGQYPPRTPQGPQE